MILLVRENSLKTFWAQVSISILTSSACDVDKNYADVSQSKIQVATSDDFVNFVYNLVTWIIRKSTGWIVARSKP
jgi:hypothetical protein